MDETELDEDLRTDEHDFAPCSVPTCKNRVPCPPFLNAAGQALCDEHAVIASHGRCGTCGGVFARQSMLGFTKAYASEKTGKALCIDCWASEGYAELHGPRCTCMRCRPDLEDVARVVAEYRARLALEKRPGRPLKHVINRMLPSIRERVQRLYRDT